MDSQKRLMLALALSFAVVTVWTLFFGPKAPPPQAGTEGADAGVTTALPPAASPPVAGLDAGEALAPVVVLSRDFQDVHAKLSSAGAGLVQAQLQGPKMRESEHYTVLEGFEHAFGSKRIESPQVNL